MGHDVDKFKVGDRVGALCSGAFTTSHIVPQALCFKIPNGKSFEETAGVPFAYSTAIHGLVDKAKIEEGMVSDPEPIIRSSLGDINSTCRVF